MTTPLDPTTAAGRQALREMGAAALVPLLDEIDRLEAELSQLRADLLTDDEAALIDAERSSAAEAANVLLTALGWQSGGMAAAALEIVAERHRLKAELARCREAMVRLLDEACNGGYHKGVVYAHGSECRCESCVEARLALGAMEAARAALSDLPT